MAKLAPIRFRMCDEDRDAYGGPEWVTFDRERFKHLPGSELMAFEAATGFPLTGYFDDRIDSAHGQRARLWVARRMAGLVDDWDKFDPRILLVDMEIVKGGDAGPPDGPSGTGSEV